MQYIDSAIKNKKYYIDIINSNLELLHKVLKEKLNCSYEVTPVERMWEGGCSSQFIIKTSSDKFFLKVKSSFVKVESKLEEESDPIELSCLENEYKMLMAAQKAKVQTPDIIFFHQEENIDFLCLQYLEDSFLETLKINDVDKIISFWNQLKLEVKKLYDSDIVHTDIHEYNIRFDKGRIYLIDFEEARFIKQDDKFEESLDFVGHNAKSTLGVFPHYFSEKYSIPYNSLSRIKQVINEEVAMKLFEYAKECNYDSSNGICTALDHGKSKMTYQEISNEYFSIGGQRSNDTRIGLINSVCDSLIENRFTFIDVGSNNGTFVRTLSKINKNVIRGIGLEGFSKFNKLAKGLAFLENIENNEYVDFKCGEDSIDSLEITGEVVLSVCSVWHHIQNKKQFLDELKKMDIRIGIFEFASQEELYKNRTWREEAEFIKEYLDFKEIKSLSFSKDYNRPIVLLSKENVDDLMLAEIMSKYEAYCEKIKNINKPISYEDYCKRKVNDKKYYICFGAGEYGRKAIQFLKGNVVFFIDNDLSKKEFEGYKVVSLEEVEQNIAGDTTIIISTSQKYYGEIKKQLSKINSVNVITFEDFIENGYRN